MAGKGKGTPETLSDQINILKGLMVFSNALIMLLGLSILGVCLWLRFDESLGEWITDLEIKPFYIGLYILLVVAAAVLVLSLLGCLAAFRDDNLLFYIFIGSQILLFILGLAGSAVLLDHSTQQSKLQPLIRESMRRMIINSHHEKSKKILAVVQENIACCGADGPDDYLSLRQPLPPQCRNTVTGNTYFYGCVDELTWFFEEKTGWVSGLSMTMCLLHVVNVVLSVVLVQALKKEEEASYNYRH